MKKYTAYLDDGESVIKVAVPANNAAGVKRYYRPQKSSQLLSGQDLEKQKN